MIYSQVLAEDELKSLIEETFDLCTSNKDEIRWIICLLRGFMNIPNKNTKYCAENFKINKWQYDLHPILEKYKQRWKCSNYVKNTKRRI